MEYEEFNLQNISDSFFRIGYFSAVILLKNLRMDNRVTNFEDFVEWIDHIEKDSSHQSEWKDAERFVNDVLIEHDWSTTSGTRPEACN